MPADYKTLSIKPLTGLLDVVSAPDAVPLGGFRYRQNFAVFQQNTLARDFGWRKFLTQYSNYANADLHDQLSTDNTADGVVLSENLQTYYDELDPVNPLAAQVTEYPPDNTSFGTYCSTTQQKRDSALETQRQPITLIYSATATTGQRKLIIGVQTRLYVLNEASGNVKLIADGMSGKPKLNCTGPRFQCAQVEDYVVFTNNYDPPVYWTFDQPTFGCDQRAVSNIPDLETIGLQRAACIYSWKGFIFLGDVEMDNQRYEDRVIWSDAYSPTSFDPAATGTLAGQQDLGYGEKIMAFSEVGDYLVLFTARGIWIVTVVTDATGLADLNFRNVYSGGLKREACLAYRNTLVAVGDALYFGGQDAIYRWGLSFPKPERIEWIHRAAGVMYNDINEAACDAHCAGYDPDTKTLWVSWVQDDSIAAWPTLVPSKTLCFNLRYEAAHVVDFGFTAFGNWVSDTRGTITQFLLDYCGCQTEAQLEAALADIGLTPTVKEGATCEPSNPECPAGIENIPLYTNEGYSVPGTDLIVENYNKAEADSDSFCTRLDGLAFDDICIECDTNRKFVMASGLDFCLKEYGGAYHRERYLGLSTAPLPTAGLTTRCGDVYANYALDGYTSILRTSAMGFDAPKFDKNLGQITMDYVAEPQAQPPNLNCRVGVSAQAADSNDPKCVILWKTLEPVQLKCLTTSTELEHTENNTRPNYVADFPTFYTGRFLYAEFTVTGRGGAATFSEFSMDIKAIKKA